MQRIIQFEVLGMAPAPQGSKINYGAGRPLVESCKQLKPWRQLLALEARRSGAALLTGPVAMEAVFMFHRPKGHYGASGLRPSAPAHHCVKPDVSKLLRAVEDALSKILFEDDARIVATAGRKAYVGRDAQPGAAITIHSLT